MNSKEIVAAYKAKLSGQQLLVEDDDFILRHTSFKSISPLFDKQVLVHWWMNVHIPPGSKNESTPSEIFRSWDNAIYGRFKYVRPGMTYNLDTRQVIIKIGTRKSDELKPQIEELEMWLPFVKGHPKVVDIFEHTLSRWEIYKLHVSPGLYKVKTTSRTIASFDNIIDTVSFIRKNHWYED